MFIIPFVFICSMMASAAYIPSCFEKAREHQCSTKEKISCNGPLGSCSCDDGQTCIWTNMGSVKGCPCKDKEKYDYSFIERAKEHGCNDDKFECKGGFCNCSCIDGSSCVWSGNQTVVGCPCKVKKDWGNEPTPTKSKEELNKRRQERDQLKKERDQNQVKEEKINKKQRVVIEDI